MITWETTEIKLEENDTAVCIRADGEVDLYLPETKKGLQEVPGRPYLMGLILMMYGMALTATSFEELTGIISELNARKELVAGGINTFTGRKPPEGQA